MASIEHIDTAPPPRPAKIFIRRHSILTRVTHWINVLCLTLLLMSGMQIFNADPQLHWGNYGAVEDPSWFEIASDQNGDTIVGRLRIGSLSITTTGILGASMVDGEMTPRDRKSVV